MPRLLPKRPLSDSIALSKTVWDREGRLLRLTLSADQRYRIWAPLHQFPTTLRNAFLFYEDKHFYRHPGVNPFSLGRAAFSSAVRPHRLVGGSTITMQLARLLYDLETNSLAGKLRQIAHSVMLELRYTKNEIFEAYLNVVPMGGNIEGAATASRIFYGKPIETIDETEAIGLAVIPQNPVDRSPLRSDASAWRHACKRFAKDWLNQTLSDQHLPQLIATKRNQRPFLAPHLVDTVLQRSSNRNAHQLTVNVTLQDIVSRHLRFYVESVRKMGIVNAAALLVDHRDMSVTALIGSADYFDKTISGQVNGALAKRSPGSTLKPFIYALAFEHGLIHPHTMLRDVPMVLHGFVPENFDHEFVGPLSAEHALVRSRNIPALDLFTRLPQSTFYQLLNKGLVSSLQPETHYGPSIILGGAELSMVELAQLYAALANRGFVRPLRYDKEDPIVEGVPLMSPESAFVTLTMLEKNPRPDHLIGVTTRRAPHPVAWKTGTSPRFRDAWTVGVFGPYVLAVWLGDFSGKFNPSLVGRDLAAPLFFNIVDDVSDRYVAPSDFQRQKPSELRLIDVCSVSGDLPQPYCPHRASTWYWPGHSPIKRCDVHREVVISRKTKLRTCPPYQDAVQTHVYEFWDSAMMNVFNDAGISRRAAPAWEKRCLDDKAAQRGTPLRITSPQTNTVYTLTHTTPRPAISFRATSDADAQEIFWFVDKQYIGKEKANRPVEWSAQPGTFTVRAIDNLGRSDTRKIRVSASGTL